MKIDKNKKNGINISEYIVINIFFCKNHLCIIIIILKIQFMSNKAVYLLTGVID
jgi:hypothetical protein